MPKRSGRRKLSHSTKKVQRRSGSELVRCKKSKRKVHLHPGKAKMGNNTPALRRAAREAKRNPDPDAMDTGDQKKEPDATAARREARQSMGKQLREQELAKRRGLARQMGGGGLDDDLPDGGEDGGEGAEDAGAFTVGRPLAQKAFERELSKVLQASDILVEVLDARDPLGCRCKPLEDAVLTKWQSKRVVLLLNTNPKPNPSRKPEPYPNSNPDPPNQVLLLNKCDLVPPDVVTKPSNPSPNPDPNPNPKTRSSPSV